MTTTVKLSSRLPDDPDVNGLEHHFEALKARPFEQRVAVVYFDVAKTTTDYEKATINPLIRVVAIEVVGDVADVPPAVVDAFNRARERRRQQGPLPFDDEPPTAHPALTDGIDVDASIEQANRRDGGIDLITGEVLEDDEDQDDGGYEGDQ